METAPLYNDLASGPDGGEAVFLRASDGINIRVALWPSDRKVPAKGTVLLFPGRTEYIEKYGIVAGEFARRGYCVLAVDWRCQGLADRLAGDPMLGHVGDFADYQADVDALVDFATTRALPKPWHLVAHSMGGCIGLRSLHGKLPVNSAVFTGPMWGIFMKAWIRPPAWLWSRIGRRIGFDKSYAPTTSPTSYVLTEPFEGNSLTKDRDMWDFMVSHARAVPQFQLGGPSLTWLSEALDETAILRSLPCPSTPALTIVGKDESIVDKDAINHVMSGWENGQMQWIDHAEHEVMMEIPETREALYDAATDWFERHA